MLLPLFLAVMLASGSTSPAPDSCFPFDLLEIDWASTGGKMLDAHPAHPGPDSPEFAAMLDHGLWLPVYDTVHPAVNRVGVRWLFFTDGPCFVAGIAVGRSGEPT